jgi:hypothetical protein
MQGQKVRSRRYWGQSGKHLEEILQLVGGWNTSALQTQGSGQRLSRFHGPHPGGEARRREGSHRDSQFLEQISAKTCGGRVGEVVMANAAPAESGR